MSPTQLFFAFSHLFSIFRIINFRVLILQNFLLRCFVEVLFFWFFLFSKSAEYCYLLRYLISIFAIKLQSLSFKSELIISILLFKRFDKVNFVNPILITLVLRHFHSKIFILHKIFKSDFINICKIDTAAENILYFFNFKEILSLS